MSSAPVEPAAGAEMLPGEPLGNVRSRARLDLESRDSVGDALISTSARKPEIVVQISIFDFSYRSSHQRNDILGTSVRQFFLIATVSLLLISRLYASSDNIGSIPVNVTAILEDKSSTIPSNFVGLSLETQDIIADTIYTGSNTSLQNLVKLLGPNGILRVGGTSQDTGHQGNPTPALTQRIANDLAGFNSALGSGWSLIYGLDLGSNNPSEAVTQAGYIINAFGIGNVIFQIGNEPDNWYSPSTYTSMWNDYFSSLSTSYPSIIFAAPDVAELISIAQHYAVSLTPGISGLSSLSAHFYGVGCNPVSISYASYLANPASQAWTANYAPGKLRLTESGGICAGGQLGYTNVLLQATWYLNTAIAMANDGWVGFNYHSVMTPYAPWGGRISYYNPYSVQDDKGYSPTPVFYGMLLFSKIEGQQIVGTSLLGPSTVKAISTKGAGANANILIVNNDTSYPLLAKPDQSNIWSTAEIYVINSSVGCVDTSPALNGYVIGEGGSWAGSPAILNRGDSISIAPCGAALVEIQH